LMEFPEICAEAGAATLSIEMVVIAREIARDIFFRFIFISVVMTAFFYNYGNARAN
jgi:hypothetical protein